MNVPDTIRAAIATDEARQLFEQIFSEWQQRGAEIVRLCNELSGPSQAQRDLKLAQFTRDVREEELSIVKEIATYTPTIDRFIAEQLAFIAQLRAIKERAK